MQNTQFGFRKALSTSTPLACVRRVLERCEASKNPLFLVFLDWEKTFDRVKQDKLFEALSRMGVPSQYIEAIKSLYNNPQFAVRMGSHQSTWRTQNRGIRQGCPLSPYLFVILMTVMFRDVHAEINLERGRLQGLSFTELLYADDTALVTNNVNAMNRLLTQIENHATYYGLNFNKTKCVSFCFNTKGKPVFADHRKVPEQDEAMYLGGVISKVFDVRKEVNKKISACFGVLTKLNEFWFRSSCPPKFKITVFDAIVRSKLVYGLEGIQLPKHLSNKLDVFQLKGLRKILGWKTTFVDRNLTNKRVLEAVSEINNPKRIPGKDIRKFSDYVLHKQRALLKHTVRAPPEDPLRQCTFETTTSVPIMLDNLRVGRPRDKWANSILEGFYVELGKGTQSDFRNNFARECNLLGDQIKARSL